MGVSALHIKASGSYRSLVSKKGAVMANQEQLEIFRKGIAAWNKWKKSTSGSCIRKP